jgi:hypothetical protein
MYAAGSLQGIKIVIFVAVFHGVHSDYTILWIFTEEQHGPEGGVAEAAGVRVRHLGQGEPGPLPGRGKISTVRLRIPGGGGPSHILSCFPSILHVFSGIRKRW